MTDKELLTQVLSELRYIKERQDDFIDTVHQWRIEANEVHAEQELETAQLRDDMEQRTVRLQDQMNNFVWLAGKVAMGAAALLNGVAVVLWFTAKVVYASFFGKP